MEQYCLFCVIRDLILSIDPSFSISFSDMDFTQPLAVGVYIRGGIPVRRRDLASGRYAGVSARVQLTINAGESTESLMTTLSLLSEIRTQLSEACNHSFDVADVCYNSQGRLCLTDTLAKRGEAGAPVKLLVTLTRMTGDVGFKGVSELDMPVYSCNFQIQYSLTN